MLIICANLSSPVTSSRMNSAVRPSTRSVATVRSQGPIAKIAFSDVVRNVGVCMRLRLIIKKMELQVSKLEKIDARRLARAASRGLGTTAINEVARVTWRCTSQGEGRRRE